MRGLHRYRAYLSYWLDAVDEHSLHSPFLFDLMTQVIRMRPSYCRRIEQLRRELRRDPREITVDDLGTGAITLPRNRRISSIARKSLSPARFSSLYRQLIAHFQCRTVVELGTSLGVNTLYLAQPSGTRVTTFEGAQHVAAVARANFAAMRARNITVIEGNIGITLKDFVARAGRVDFAFLDANHTRAATMEYFGYLLGVLHDESIVVVDDIHLTGEMEHAWQEVRGHGRVRATADLYRCGIAFFSPSLDKQHVVLKA